MTLYVTYYAGLKLTRVTSHRSFGLQNVHSPFINNVNLHEVLHNLYLEHRRYLRAILGAKRSSLAAALVQQRPKSDRATRVRTRRNFETSNSVAALVKSQLPSQLRLAISVIYACILFPEAARTPYLDRIRGERAPPANENARRFIAWPGVCTYYVVYLRG